MNSPFFSIVIPSYNRSEMIVKTIASVLQQTFNDFEIIVVDDGGTDNTEEVVCNIKDKRIQYFKKQNGERAAARNCGAAIARGQFVNFFDSDDIALPNHLQEAHSLLSKHPDAVWFHLGYAFADPNDQVFRAINSLKGDTLNPIVCDGNPLSCNGVFIRKDIITQHKFNEDRNLSASEDYELWCRLAARFPLYYSNTITSWVVDHDLRSVRTINGAILINRLSLLVQYLKKDEQVITYFGKDFSKIEMDSNSYIALHLADVPKYKLRSVVYTIKAMSNNLSLLRKKRFYAILKNLIIKW
ncbi:MAG: glycosyltransferase [Phycisphaerales bacterium]|nr:glycosyltransferase [Phycisphaerales bacterium]